MSTSALPTPLPHASRFPLLHPLPSFSSLSNPAPSFSILLLFGSRHARTYGLALEQPISPSSRMRVCARVVHPASPWCLSSLSRPSPAATCTGHHSESLTEFPDAPRRSHAPAPAARSALSALGRQRDEEHRDAPWRRTVPSGSRLSAARKHAASRQASNLPQVAQQTRNSSRPPDRMNDPATRPHRISSHLSSHRISSHLDQRPLGSKIPHLAPSRPDAR